MTTWKEARVAKANRLEREQRHYRPENLGPPCPVCKTRIVKALAEQGIETHPTCLSLEFGRGMP